MSTREIIIHDGNAHEFVAPIVAGELKGTGLVPRDYSAHPVGYLACARPFDLPLIPESEWQSRLDAQKAARAQLSDVRDRGMGGQPIPARNQGQSNFCWAHSSTGATILVRAANNQPYADLSAFAVACKIKGFRNQGGWGAESLEFIAENGVPTSAFWPQQSWDRSHDNATTWTNGALHRVSEWMDLDPQDVKAQLVTCLLSNIPVIVDYNWWSHSVCAIDVVSFSPFQIRILNSWGDSWSQNGTGILSGRRAIPDGAIAPRVVKAATA